MATYRQIHITYWQDPFVEDLKPLYKYFYLYLLTNSKTTQCGCYEISDKLIKYETGLEQKQIDEMLKHFADSKRIVFNKPNNEILLLNWLKHNSFKSPKVKACIERELISIKTSDFKQFIHDIINNNIGIDRLSIDYEYTMDTQSQEEEEEEEEKEEEKKEKKNKKEIAFIHSQHLSMTETEYNTLVELYGKSSVDKKIEYSDNYAKLKNYTSLYKTLNNWLKSDEAQKPKERTKEDQFKLAADRVKANVIQYDPFNKGV